MFEYMMQGIAHAGGVPVPPGRSLFPRPAAPVTRPAWLRRGFGLALEKLSRQLRSWSEKLLQQNPVANISRCGA